METLHWSLDLFKKSCLLEYLVQCASAVQYPFMETVWTGNLSKGYYGYENGSGDGYRAAWEGERLMVMVFDHESDRSALAGVGPVDWEDEAALLRKWVGDFPSELEDLYEKARRGMAATTSGIWGVGGQLFVGYEIESSTHEGLWMLERHTKEPEKALFGEDSLVEEHSLSEEQGRAVLGLLEHSGELPYRLTQDDIRQLLIVRSPEDEVPSEDVDTAKAMLRAAGYLWD